MAGSSLVWCDSDAKGLQTNVQMSEHINNGCARLDVGMKYEANPACCLDLLTAALDEEHCGMTEEEAQSLNIGHAFELDKVGRNATPCFLDSPVRISFHPGDAACYLKHGPCIA